MRSLIAFLSRHSTLFLFLLLEGIAFTLFLQRHAFQQYAFLSSANRVIGSMDALTTGIKDYFLLRTTNNLLIEENATLRRQADSLQLLLEDYAENASTTNTRTVFPRLSRQYIPAKVINTTLFQANNYLTLNKGTLDGVERDMAVINEQGIVGVIKATSEHYATVLPVIHTQFATSCRINKPSYVGTLRWEDRDWRYAHIRDIAEHVPIQIGDTIYTSGLSQIFPEGILIGTISNIESERPDGFYNIEVQLSTDFKRLRYVQVVVNPYKEEQDKLETTP